MARMTFRKWWDTYRPKRHRLRSKSFEHCLYDAWDEREKHRAFDAYTANPKSVWTFMEMDGRLYIVAGYALVNRLGYFVCSVPFENEMVAPEVPLGRL